MKLILLAAGKSSRIYKKLGKHKCLLKIRNKTLIEKIIDDARSCGLKKIDVIVGFKKENIMSYFKNSKIKFIYNKYYNTYEMLYSFILGLKNSNDDLIMSYTDIFYEKKIFKKLLQLKSKNIILPILTNWKSIWKKRDKSIVDDAETLKMNKAKYLLEIGNKINKINQVNGQYMGILFVPKEMKEKLLKIYTSIKMKKKLHMTNFLNVLIKKDVRIKCIPYRGIWYEFDDMEDVQNF